MKYNTLISRVKSMHALKKEVIDLEKKVIEITYQPSILSDQTEKVIYNIEISKDLEYLLNLTGETNGKVKLMDKGEDAVIAYPDCYFSIKNDNNEEIISWKGQYAYYLINKTNNEILIKTVFYKKVGGNSYYNGCVHPIEEFVGFYKKHLIGVEGEYYVVVLKDGTTKKICYKQYPESGRDDHQNAYISGNEFIQECYVYYDCDLKHGGWEEYKFDLDKYLE